MAKPVKAPVTKQEVDSATQHLPTIKTLKDAIPESCFDSSAFTSLSYVARDLLYAAILAYGAVHIDLISSHWLRITAWAFYGFFQGCVGTGLWILAHECGHGAFSKHPRLNDFVGWVLHSSLLVPYFSWKITHARHHRYTGHIDKDTAFVPWTDLTLAKKLNVRAEQLKQLAEDTPIMSFLNVISHQLIGFQLYLFFNVTAGAKSGPEGEYKKGLTLSHFDPSSGLWTRSQRFQVILSDLGLLIMGSVLYYASTQIGWGNVALLHFVPYFWVHHWIVAITYLQHTHPDIPHYTSEAWTFQKGALATVDRTIGFIGRHFFHEIIDFHVVHHLFSKIPFYKAEEATNAIRPLLGQEYHEQKDEFFLYSLMTTFRRCIYVAEQGHAKEYSPGVLHWVFANRKPK